MTKNRIDRIVSETIDQFKADQSAKDAHRSSLLDAIDKHQDKLTDLGSLVMFVYVFGLKDGAKMGIDALLHRICEGDV